MNKKSPFRKLFLKPIAAALVLTFSSSQLLYAADVRQMLIDAKARFIEDDQRRGGLSAEELADGQTYQQQAIDQQQELLENKFSLTTQNGDILHYVGNVLKGVDRPDGTRLNNIVLDANGAIVAADLRLSDGSLQIFGNGAVIGQQAPDGRQVLYENGRIQKVIAKDGTETLYSYTFDPQGNVVETVLESASFRSVYDVSGKLVRTVNKTDLSESRFSDGVLDSVLSQDGTKLLFTQEAAPEGLLVRFGSLLDPAGNKHKYGNGHLVEIVLSSGWSLKDTVVSADGASLLAYKVYDETNVLVSAEGEVTHAALAPPVIYAWAPVQSKIPFESALYAGGILREAVNNEGYTLRFNAEGLLAEALDPQGVLTQFAFTESSLENLTSSRVVKNGLASTYDVQGRLSSVALNGLTIHYKAASDEIDWIEKTDGTELHDLVFDASGNVTHAEITTPDGEVRTYADGKLISLTHPDTTEIFYFDDKPTKLITSRKLEYNFSYTPETIEATLNAQMQIPDALTPIQMQYDTAFNLKKLIRQNNEVLSYLGNDLHAIETPNESPKVFDYVKDTNGKVLSYTITQGNVITEYDADNTPTFSVIASTPENPHTLNVAYRYGKIREIQKDGVLTFKYNYTFDASGAEITTIRDVEEKTTKIYKEGLLLTDLAEETSVLSTYTYTPDSNVSHVAVSRLGKTLHSYHYTYPNNLTVVTDEEGVIRTYSSAQKLLSLEKEDQKFAYSYSNNADGEEIVEEKLIEKRLTTGATVHYDLGKITKIDMPDGAFITDIILNPDNTFKQATVTQADGTKNVFDSASILETIEPDETHFYFTDGALTKVAGPDGKELLYRYEKDTNGDTKAVWVRAENADLKYDLSGALLGLKLNNVLTPEAVSQATGHVYAGGTGAYSTDNDYTTAQSLTDSRSFDQNQGNVYLTVTSTHSFPEPQTLTQVRYSALGGGDGYGDYGGHGSGAYSIEYQLADGTWVVLPGGSGGGASGQVTKDVNISGVTAVRAFAYGYGEGSDHGGCYAHALIYEIQWKLADQSYLAFSQTKDPNGALTGYKFEGIVGAITFDAQGSLLSGVPLKLNDPAQSLNGRVGSFVSEPYFSKMNAPSVESQWSLTAKDSILDVQTMVSQEYSASGTLETQTKVDGTVTLFENNKPSKVLSPAGEVLIEYSYDAEGNPSRVYLKNARDVLPDEVLKAKQQIETDRASTLQALAAQQNLAYQSIESQVAAQKNALLSQLSALEQQFNDVSGISAKGKQAKSQKGDALNQIGGAMDQVRAALAALSAQEADAYAALDSAVGALSDQIKADAETAFTALAEQEKLLKNEILRQETSPIIYDYYRRILGRDPSSAEYQYWINKLDYDTQKMAIDQVHEEERFVDPLFFDGAGDFAAIPDSEDWNFGNQDFTVDFWVRFDSVSGYEALITQGTSTSTYMKLYRNGSTWRFYSLLGGADVVHLDAPDTLSANTWYHVALVREGGALKLYRDGQLKGSYITAAALPDYSSSLTIGAMNYGTSISSAYDLAGAMDEVRVTKGVARWTAPFSPTTVRHPADASTKLVLRMDSNGRLIDASNSGRSIAVIGMLPPSRDSWMAFDGSNDNVTAPDSDDWNFGAQDFTIDFWVKLDSISGYDALIAQGLSSSNSMRLYRYGSTWRFYALSGGNYVVKLEALDSLAANTWYHIALVREGGLFQFFRDGQLKGAYETTAALPDYTEALKIGDLNYSTLFTSYDLGGALDEVRISKGVARWSAPFTPVAGRYEADSFTKLLLRGGEGRSFVDHSLSARAVVLYGNAGPVTKAVSNLVERLTIHTTVYKTAAEAVGEYLASLPELGERTAYVNSVKSKVTAKIQSYLSMTDVEKQAFASSLGLTPSELAVLSQHDADLVLNWLNSRSLHFGQSAFLSLESLLDQKGITYSREDIAEKAILVDILTGVISPLDDGDLVLSVYSLNKVAALYGLDLSGAKLSWEDLQGIYDADSVVIEDVTDVNNAPGSSIKLDGSGDYIKLQDSDDWSFGTGDFTVDAWVKFDSAAGRQIIYSQGYADTSYSYFFWDGAYSKWYLYSTGNYTFEFPDTLQSDTWHHVAVVRSGSTFTLYRDGVSKGSFTSTATVPNYTGELSIGNLWAPGDYGYYVKGQIDGFRISKGVARYTQNFTPSTKRAAADQYTKLLLYTDPAQGIQDMSSAPHALTLVGNTQVDATVYKQTIETVSTHKEITRYPSSVGDPSLLTAAQKQDIIDHPENYNPRVIAHINGNHYVIITNITADTVTYIDPGIGQDKQNESLTVTRAGFEKVWQGNVAIESRKLETVAGYQAKTMAVGEAQAVRGAFWGSVLGLLGSILVWIPGLNILGLVLTGLSTIISVIEGDWISALSSIVTLGIAPGGLGGFFKDVFHGLTTGLGALGTAFNAVGGFIQNVYGGVTGFLGTIGDGFGQFLHGALGVSSQVGAQIARTAVSIGVSFGVSKGLEAVGVNPQLAGFFGSLAAGAVVGGMNPEKSLVNGVEVSRTQLIQSSMQQVVTLNQVGNLGLDLGLNPEFTNIIGLSLGAIQGNIITNPGTTLEIAFNSIKPQLFSSLAQYGIDKLGTSLGIDSRISGLIGSPISGALGAGLQGGVNVGQNIITAINQGLTSGIVRYGVDFVGNSSPFLGSLLSPDIVHNIELAIGRDGLFQGIFNIIQNAAINVFNVAGGAVQTVFQGVSSFGSLIQQKGGLVGALESIATSVFSRGALETIQSKGGVQGLFNSTSKTPTTLPTGQTAQELRINGSNSLYFDDVSHLIGRKDEGVYQLGDFGYDSFGNFSLLQGNVFADVTNDLDFIGGVRDGQFISIKIDGPTGTLFQVDPEKPNTPIYIEGPKPDQSTSASTSLSFDFWGGVFKLVPQGMSLFMHENVANAADFTVNSSVQASVDAASKLTYVLCNGIANPKPNPDVPPDYITNLTSDLVSRSAHAITNSDIIAVPLYQPTVTVPIFNFTDSINQGIDAVKWAVESQQNNTRTDLTNKVIQDLNTYFWRATNYAQLVRPMIAMGYSGGFMPLVEAIANQRYNVTTLVALGAATVDLGKDLAAVVVKIFGAIEQYIAAKAQAQLNAAAGFIQQLYGFLFFLKPVQDAVNQAINAIQGDFNQGMSLIADIISASNPRVNLVSLANTKVKQILNVWGTEDVLYKFGLGGKRVNLCDVNTINVQIEGATHFDYMYRTSWNNETERVWNRQVSNFVTDLIRASESKTKTDAFFSQHSIFLDANGVYQVSRSFIESYVA